MIIIRVISELSLYRHFTCTSEVVIVVQLDCQRSVSSIGCSVNVEVRSLIGRVSRLWTAHLPTWEQVFGQLMPLEAFFYPCFLTVELLSSQLAKLGHWMVQLCGWPCNHDRCLISVRSLYCDNYVCQLVLGVESTIGIEGIDIWLYVIAIGFITTAS